MKNVSQIAVAVALTAMMMQAQEVPGFPNQPSPASLAGTPAAAPAAAQEAAPAAGAVQGPTQEEIDAVRKLQGVTDPNERMKAADDFAIRYPKSPLLSMALTMAGEAAQTLQNSIRTQLYYKRAIDADPKADYARIMLGADIAQSTPPGAPDFTAEMTRAQKLVEEGMALINQREMAQGQNKDDFETGQKDDLSKGHMALGLIHMANQRNAEAGKEFVLAVDTAKNVDLTNLLRAGMAFNNAQQFDQANAALDRFIATPGLPQQYKDIAKQEKDRGKAIQDAAKK